jgi:thioredoxin-related protein
MRTSTLRSAAAAACLFCAAGAVQAEEKIAWAKSLQAARAQAKATHKLVMADFYADWCGWCKKLDQEVYTDPKVIPLLGQFVPVKINAEKEGVAAAKKYGVRGYPDLLFLEPSGEKADRIEGYMPPERFAERLAQIAERWRAFPQMQARLHANPGDVEAAAKLIESYAARGDQERVLELLAQAEKADPRNTTGHLAKAYNAAGDYFQMVKNEVDKAIPLFQKAVATGREPYDIGYGRISLFWCYLSQTKLPEAQAELEAILAISNVTEAHKRRAQELLEDLRKRARS